MDFRRRVTALVAAALLALALGACSKGSNKSAAPAQATTTFPVPSTTLAVRNTTDPFCRFLATYNDRFGKVGAAGLGDPQQFRTVMQDAAAAIKDAAASAPPAIKADVTTMSDGFQKFLGILQQVNFDLTKLTGEQLSVINTPTYTNASQRLDAYTKQNCV